MYMYMYVCVCVCVCVCTRVIGDWNQLYYLKITIVKTNILLQDAAIKTLSCLDVCH